MAHTDPQFSTLLISVQNPPSRTNPIADRLRRIHALQDELTSAPSSHDKIELAMAVATSLDISSADESPLVWLITVDPPSADKTQTVQPLRNTPVCFFLDSLTAQSFISGYINPHTGKPADDLLPKLDGKCLVFKDMTSLFAEREEKVRAVLVDALQRMVQGAFAWLEQVVVKLSYQERMKRAYGLDPLVWLIFLRILSI